MTYDHPAPANSISAPPGARAKLRALTAAFIVVCVLAGVLAMSTLVYIAVENKANGDRLVDCTTPAGKCFQRSQKTTGEAVGQINQIIVASNFCAVQVTEPLTDSEFKKFTECIRARLSKTTK